jgi:hypothetical protein
MQVIWGRVKLISEKQNPWANPNGRAAKSGDIG